MALIICRSCKAEISDKSAFCPYCYEALEKKSEIGKSVTNTYLNIDANYFDEPDKAIYRRKKRIKLSQNAGFWLGFSLGRLGILATLSLRDKDRLAFMGKISMIYVVIVIVSLLILSIFIWGEISRFLDLIIS